MLDFELSTFIFQMVNFVVLLAILAWFFYKPVLRVMRGREESINARMEAVAKRNAELDSKEKELEEQRRTTQEQIERLLADARSEAADIKREAADDAHRRSESLVEEAKRRSDERVRAGAARLQTEAQEAALHIAASIIDRIAGATVHDALLAQFIANLPNASADAARKEMGKAGAQVTVETAQPLTDEGMVRLRTALAGWLGGDEGNLHLNVREDAALEAGVRVTVGTTTLEMSLRSLIEDLKDSEQPEPAA